MLSILSFKTLPEKKQFFNNLDFEHESIVVCSIFCKKILQLNRIKNSNFVENDSIFVVQDLWLKLLNLFLPQYKVVSEKQIKIFIKKYFSNNFYHKEKKINQKINILLSYLNQLIIVFTHPQGDELIKEWFEQNPVSYKRWGYWYDLAYEAWMELKKNNLILAAWANAVLLDSASFSMMNKMNNKMSNKTLIFDLSAHINQIDVELIVLLSKSIDVKVIIPNPEFKDKFSFTLKPYEYLWTFSKQEISGKKNKNNDAIISSSGKLDNPYNNLHNPTAFNNNNNNNNNNRQRIDCYRFSSMLSEIKNTCFLISDFVEQGVNLDDIAIIAPDIEKYWPILFHFLNEEGILVNKNYQCNYRTYKCVSRLLSRLKIKNKQASSADLELDVFSSKLKMSFFKFKQLFTIIYDYDDIARDDQIYQYYYGDEIDLKKEINRDEFIIWVIKLWEGDETQILEKIIQEILLDVSSKQNFFFYHWIEYLELLCKEKNIVKQKADYQGIFCINLIEAQFCAANYNIILGLNQESLRQVAKTQILTKDVLSILNNIGFVLPPYEKQNLEFELQWLLLQNKKKFILSVPSVDFQSNILSPSLFWLEEVLKKEQNPQENFAPNFCRWDLIQRTDYNEIPNFRNISPLRHKLLIDTLNQDKGEIDFSNYLIKDNNQKNQQNNSIYKNKYYDENIYSISEFIEKYNLKLSVSKLDDYLKCPFVFLLKHFFYLLDQPLLDFEIDKISSGKLIHSLFAQIINQGLDKDLKKENALLLIMRNIEDNDLKVAEKKFLPFLIQKYSDIIEKFIIFEKGWRKIFPRTRTIAVEKKFSCFLDLNKGLNAKNGFPFSGYIDRIDDNQDDQVVLIDYKLSGYNIKQYQKWVENNIIQLVLYSQVLEKGLLEGITHNLVGSFFYIVQNFTRTYGFKIKGHDESLFSFKDKNRNIIDFKKKQELYQQIDQKVQEVLKGILNKQFYPNPQNNEICNFCFGNKICRASHLN